ncbi:helix-turn-helix domain-containing protein [Nonomuraea sp. NPDC004580]|uniref:winged helix-turn-helix transcriptional regulator n=1 Tax=Nonomuraea sp. NPDC004580 TaxID=3154552 RepID=UPI0033B217B4
MNMTEYGSGMEKRRSYGEGCPVSHALDLVGERWALLVVRELMLGPKRFSDLRDGLCGASSNILTRRLRDLEGIGVLRRQRAGVPVSTNVYELTDWGRSLEPVLFALGNWAVMSPWWDKHAPSTVDSLLLSLRSQAQFFFPGGMPVTGVCDMRVGDDRFTLRFDEAGLAIARAAAYEADALVRMDAHTLKSLVNRDETLDDAIAAGRVRIEGDDRLIRTVIK